MTRKSLPLLALGLLGLLATAIPTTAQAQPGGRVDLEGTHWRCYIVAQQTPDVAATVTLEDQFNPDTPSTVSVGEPLQFCAPTTKRVLPDGTVSTVEDENAHLTMYLAPLQQPNRLVEVTNQFGTFEWAVGSARVLLAPAGKVHGTSTFPLADNEQNHFWCYEATGDRANLRVELDDQFNGPDRAKVGKPRYLCNPVEKVHGGTTFPIEDEDLHLTCYEITGRQATDPTTVAVETQFEEDMYQITAYELLCAPAEKTFPAPAS